jgi:hypothetical protein
MKKVKEVYFEEGSNYPTFVLEDGEVKHPVITAHLIVSWQNEKLIDHAHLKQKRRIDISPFRKKISVYLTPKELKK